METLLITRSDFEGVVNLSEHNAEGDELLNQYIRERQFLDLTGLLGTNFLEDVLTNVAAPGYADLLDGAVWADDEGKKRRHYGLRRVLIHYVFAAYAYRGHMVDTPFSFVQKAAQDSVPIPTGDLRALHTEHRKIAYQYWEQTHKYLCEHKGDFEEFDPCNCVTCNNCGVIGCSGCDKGRPHNTRGYKTKVIRGK